MRRIDKANQKRKVVKIIVAPIKILSKVREFYMKGMEDCASRLGNGGVMGGAAVHVSQLPKSFSVKSSKSGDGDEEFRELLCAASKRAMQGGECHQISVKENGGMQGKRSYSVWIGKIGRIDEDKPCSFEGELVSPRTRSYA